MRLDGTGRFNGRTGYRFNVDATPGSGQPGSADRLRLRISHTDAATSAEVIDYDNGTANETSMASAAVRIANVSDDTLHSNGKLRLVQPAPAR